MTDIREDILARLVELMTEAPGIATTIRNNTDWVDRQMPVAMVLDGDEEVVADKPRVLVMAMTPEITIIEQSDAIGSDLTTFRRELIPLVLTDATLLALTGSNGSIRYLGCDTQFGWQQKMYGALILRFAFKYPLETNHL
jgi:hypothetical protein